MKLRRLRKAEDSHPQGQCPALYLTEDPAWMVAQGKILDSATFQQMEERADDESGVLLPTETAIRSIGLLLAEAGRPDLAADIEAVLIGSVTSR